MPRPPVIETVDWSEVLSQAKSYFEWVADAEYSENVDTMQKVSERVKLSESDRKAMDAISREIHVVVFAEDWCGDVVRHIPTLEKLVDCSESVCTYYLPRTAAPDVFARYLTNGGEAIPKFVFLNNEFVECGNWGPMQSDCKKLIARGKACGDVSSARKLVAQKYAEDEAQKAVIAELRELFDIASATVVE